MSSLHQTTIRSIIGVTMLVAGWLALGQIAPNIAWMVLGMALLAAASILFRRAQMLFWTPLAICLNWVTVSFVASWILPSELLMFSALGAASIFSISIFAVERTLRKYRHSARRSARRNGVLLTGIGNAVIAGLVVGVMIGIPILLAGLAAMFMWSPFALEFGLRMGILLPFLGLFAGAIVGLVPGFVCDIIVAMDFNKRSRSDDT